MLSLFAHAESSETHVAALVIAILCLAAGFALGRWSAHRRPFGSRFRD